MRIRPRPILTIGRPSGLVGWARKGDKQLVRYVMRLLWSMEYSVRF
jgi:hypothetical protein